MLHGLVVVPELFGDPRGEGQGIDPVEAPPLGHSGGNPASNRFRGVLEPAFAGQKLRLQDQAEGCGGALAPVEPLNDERLEGYQRLLCSPRASMSTRIAS